MAERELDPTVGGLRDEDVEGRDWERVQPRRISDISGIVGGVAVQVAITPVELDRVTL